MELVLGGVDEMNHLLSENEQTLAQQDTLGSNGECLSNTRHTLHTLDTNLMELQVGGEAFSGIWDFYKDGILGYSCKLGSGNA